MKVVRLSEHVWCLKSAYYVQAWVVKSGEGLTLIDTGVDQMAKGILEGLRTIGGKLERILLTHGHPDHVGSLETVLVLHPVPLYAHEIEIPYMEGRIQPRLSKNRPNASNPASRSLYPSTRKATCSRSAA